MASSWAARYGRSFFGMKSGMATAAAGQGSKNLLQGAKSWTNIYMVGGWIMLGMGVGIHTASHHLVHSPGVNVSKKKRLTLPELELSGDSMLSEKKYGVCRKLGRFNYSIGGHSNASSPNPSQRHGKFHKLEIEQQGQTNRSVAAAAAP